MSTSLCVESRDASRQFDLHLVSHAVAQATVLAGPDGEQIITAPTRVMKLAALENMGDLLMNVLTIATRVDPNDFVMSVGFHLDKFRMCRALATVRSRGALDEELVQVVQFSVTKFLRLLKGKDETQNVMGQYEFALEPGVLDSIKDVAAGVLTRVGGSAITYPFNIFKNGKQIAEFSGTFAPKPDICLTPTVCEVVARLDGYWHKKRLVFLETETGETFRAHWEEDGDFLKIKALANAHETLHKLSFSVSKDQLGKPIYTLIL